MNFDLTQEQSLLKDAVTRLLSDRYGFEVRRRLAGEPRGWSAEIWGQFAEMGLLAAIFAEEDGGLGGGPVETLVIGEALGAALSAEPYLATVVMGGAALRFSDNAALKAEIVPAIAAGEMMLACAVDVGRPRATADGGTWVLDGAAAGVLHGDSADRLVVAADSDAGPLVLLVSSDAAGLVRRGHRTFDGLRGAAVSFEGVRVSAGAVLARGAAADALVERIIQHAIAYLAAEATGTMAMLLDVTVEHLKTRTQFGQPLAKFQALQHRCSEMLVALEQARSMALYAAAMVDDPDPVERRKAFAAVKLVTSQAARFVGQNAVQLHGGVGVTEEHRAGWGLKRLTMIDMLFGDAEAQAATLAALGGFVEAV